MTLLVWIYQYAHLPIIIGAMVWVFMQRRDRGSCTATGSSP